MEEQKEQFKRKPAQEMSVAEARNFVGRVALHAKILSLNEEKFFGVVEDEGEQARLAFSDLKQMGGISVGDLIRVIGRSFMDLDELVVNVECIHPMNDLNKGLLEKVRELEGKFSL